MRVWHSTTCTGEGALVRGFETSTYCYRSPLMYLAYWQDKSFHDLYDALMCVRHFPQGPHMRHTGHVPQGPHTTEMREVLYD